MNWLFGFSGRMSRLDWWLAQLVIIAALIALVGILISLGVGAQYMGMSPNDAGGAGIGLSMAIVIFAAGGLMVWINMASTVKRFHDRNKSGVWFLIILVPYIGSIWQIVECGFLAGTRGGNNYGSGGSGGSRNLDDFAAQLAAEYRETTKGAVETPRATGAARVQTATPAIPPRRAAPSGFGRRGTA